MKTIISTLFCLYCLIAFSQTKTENKKETIGIATGSQNGNRQKTPQTINYENRSYQNECYKNFDFTVKNYGYNKDGKFYSWGVSVKNNYTRPIQLKYKLIVGNDNSQYGTLTTFIEPGKTYSNDFGLAKAIIVNNDSDQYKIEVSDVCFEGDDCYKNGYLDCSGKQSLNSENDKWNKQITLDDLKNALSKNSKEKAEIFKHFFIQKGFQFNAESDETLKICIDESYEDSYSGNCLSFMGFKILFHENRTAIYTNINDSPEIGEKASEVISTLLDGGVGGCDFGSIMFLK